MALDLRYITNGKVRKYYVRNSLNGSNTVTLYDALHDVPKEIRHYLEKCQLEFIGPDFARILGCIEELYPNFPLCSHPDYLGTTCAAEHCCYATHGNWKTCPYFKEEASNADI